MVRIVEKGWGEEVIFANNKLYCGKLLKFTKAGSKFSMHYHRLKDETWYILQGKFILRLLDTDNASIEEHILSVGDTQRNMPGEPHQLEALEDNSIIVEVSTKDEWLDNYRIFPGDSQKG